MLEKDLYTPFSHWVRDHYRGPSAVFELKLSRKNRLPLSEIAPHQLRALRMSATKTGLYHKISDQSQGTKPFDSFLIASAKAYLVLCWEKRAYFISITDYDAWLTDQKSITEEEAKGIGEIVVLL